MNRHDANEAMPGALRNRECLSAKLKQFMFGREKAQKMTRFGRFASVLVAALALCFAMAPCVAFAEEQDVLSAQGVTELKSEQQNPVDKQQDANDEKTMAGDVVTTKKAPKTTTELGENGINHNVSRTNQVASTKHSDGATDEATTPKSKTRVPVESTAGR